MPMAYRDWMVTAKRSPPAFRFVIWKTPKTGETTISFDGLEPVTEYYVYARYAATETTTVSPASEPATGKTGRITPDAPPVPVLYATNKTIQVTNTEADTTAYRIKKNEADPAWPDVWVYVSGTAVVYEVYETAGVSTLTAEQIADLPYSAEVVNGKITYTWKATGCIR